jgi:hypothetical protein
MVEGRSVKDTASFFAKLGAFLSRCAASRYFAKVKGVLALSLSATSLIAVFRLAIVSGPLPQSFDMECLMVA